MCFMMYPNVMVWWLVVRVNCYFYYPLEMQKIIIKMVNIQLLINVHCWVWHCHITGNELLQLTVQSSFIKENIPKSLIIPSCNLKLEKPIGQGKKVKLDPWPVWAFIAKVSEYLGLCCAGYKLIRLLKLLLGLNCSCTSWHSPHQTFFKL